MKENFYIEMLKELLLFCGCLIFLMGFDYYFYEDGAMLGLMVNMIGLFIIGIYFQLKVEDRFD